MSQRLSLTARLKSRPARRRASARPLLEALEDRLVPTQQSIVNTLPDRANGPQHYIVSTPSDNAFGSLRDCINQANQSPGSTITFDGSVFARPQTIVLSSLELPVITTEMYIEGPLAGVTISGNHQSRVFEVGDRGAAVIDFLTITQGKADGNGGGVLIDSGGTLDMGHSTLSGNFAVFGGGLYSSADGAAVLDSCTLSGNSAVSGGGLYASGSGTNQLFLSDCTVADNTAQQGDGGGLYIAETLASLINCTVTDNSAQYGNGGGVFVTDFGAAQLNNTIVAGNSANGAASDLTNQGFVNVTGDFNLSGDGSVPGAHSLVATNPLLAPLGNYGGPTQTIPLLPGSPAINAGSNALAVDVNHNPLIADQRGLGRIVGAAVDIGAFESEGFKLTVAAGNNQSAGLNAPFATALAVRVNAVNHAEPVAGGLITFTAPGAGARGTFPGGAATAQATIAADGVATAPAFTANATAGRYVVTASVLRAGGAVKFHLTNVGPPSTKLGMLAPLSRGGGTAYTFTVVYNSVLGLIDTTTLGHDQLQVTGPNGFSQTAAYVRFVSSNGGRTVTATYQVTPTDGLWDAGDNGAYRITLQISQVKDTIGQTAKAGAAGNFLVHIP